MKFFGKKSNEEPDASDITWSDAARRGLSQALDQAPIPKMLRGQVKKQLKKSAEAQARAENVTTVTQQHVLTGMLELLPKNMRGEIEQAMQSGDPSQLQNLQKKFTHR